MVYLSRATGCGMQGFMNSIRIDRRMQAGEVMMQVEVF
jgi:hypothetical protein